MIGDLSERVGELGLREPLAFTLGQLDGRCQRSS